MVAFHPLPDADEQSVRTRAKEIINKKLRPTAVDDDERHHFRREVFNEFAQLGYTAMILPKEYGGRAASHRSYYAFIEELSRSNMSIAVAVGVTNLVQGGLIAFGTDAQKKKYLPLLASGELLGAFSLSEPASGSDAASLQCKAEKVRGGYKITGNKVWCSNAGVADLYLLMARTGTHGPAGVTSFLVPSKTPGFRIGKLEKKLGLCSSTLAELVFEECFLPEENRLGNEGGGFSVALSQLDSGRVGIASVGLGVSIEAFERLWRYRLDLDKTGMTFEEGVQQRFAGHLAQIQAVKSLIWNIADLKDRGEKVTLLASYAKLLASDLAMQTTSDAVEFAGVRGFTKEFELERMMRDAKALQIVEGTNQIQRMVIAREVTKTFQNKSRT